MTMTASSRLIAAARAEWRELPSYEYDAFLEAHGHHRVLTVEDDAPRCGYWTAVSWRARARRWTIQALRAIDSIETAAALGRRSSTAAARLRRVAIEARKAVGFNPEASLALALLKEVQ